MWITLTKQKLDYPEKKPQNTLRITNENSIKLSYATCLDLASQWSHQDERQLHLSPMLQLETIFLPASKFGQFITI